MPKKQNMSDTIIDHYRTEAEKLTGTLPGFDAVRSGAIKALAGATLPTTKSELYRYSSLKKIRSTVFSQGTDPGETEAPALLKSSLCSLVFTNGLFDQNASTMDRIASDGIVTRLGENTSNGNRCNAEQTVSGDTLSLLNTALLVDGSVIHLKKNVKPKGEFELHHRVLSKDSGVHTRHVIQLDAGAELTLIETFSGSETDSSLDYWQNSSLDISVAKGAKLHHVRIVDEQSNALHTCRAHVRIAGEGEYKHFTLALNGEETRFDAHITLTDEKAHAELNAVLLGGSHTRHQMVSFVDHEKGHTTSNQIIRSVAAHGGKTAFQGKILVERGAQKTAADQSTKSLLLDRKSEVNAKPELEIYADDVKCSHGATVGELDKSALFYLMSRGVDPDTAKQILIEAFTADALKNITNTSLYDYINTNIQNWMLASGARAASDKASAASASTPSESVD